MTPEEKALMLTLSEEDIKLRYITPAIVAKGWSTNQITMETRVYLTDGKINIMGNMVSRGPKKRADYVLYRNSSTPIAIVEAKDAKHSVLHGLQQAKEYASMMDVPFAYSSNGMGFAEYDFLTGKERQFTMEEFPTLEELYERYKKEVNGGEGLSQTEEKIEEQPYCTGQEIYPPRYYQRMAVNRTLKAIANGQERLLLVMATGTGKTYTAFQIVYRLLQCGMKKKILYLADRNVLVDQSIQQDFQPLEKVTYKVNVASANSTTITAYQVYFALYQQLIGQDGAEHYKQLFRPDFFDMVIVDECHRGSARADSTWRDILTYFSSATHLGMTATPKETKYVSAISYFGEPVYTYSLNDGIEDGFLAPFKVINVKTNIGDGWRPVKGQTDIFGNEIEDRIYNNGDYDYRLILEDRIREVAHEVTLYLKSTDRMAKTIVFCADEAHAERMRSALVNENSDLCKLNPNYVVRITSSDDYGKSQLDYFRSVASPYPVIATTSKLLSTGVDCKTIKLIVLDQMIGSMTEFKQIIGRGTRISEKNHKTHFTIMDFRNVTRLFADPEWDGPIEVDPDYPPKVIHEPPKPPYPPVPPAVCPVCGHLPCTCPPPPPPPPKPIVDRDGCRVEVINKVFYFYDPDGKLLRTEKIVDYTRRNILNDYATLSTFTQKWASTERKEEIVTLFKEKGIDLPLLMEVQEMADVDIYDFICHVAYGQKPLTRRERANNVRKRDIFSKYGKEARQVLEALLEKYMNEGIREIENTAVLKNDPFRRFGTPAAIARLFGGRNEYLSAIRELEENIYKTA